MLRVKSFTFNPFEENTYVLYDETGECAVIDPGCSEPAEENELTGFIEKEKLKVKKLINTHCHIDHVLGNAFVKQKFDPPFYIHKTELQVLMAVKVYAPNYGFPGYKEVLPDQYLEEGELLHIGNQALKILFVPGHSPGHIAFYHESAKTLIAGDVLFQNSIGRTDLPGGDYDTLIRSIHTQLFTLPDEVIVYCGHGATTTIGYEKRTNPFCSLAPTQ